MKYIHLGTTNLQVSQFCLGTMMFGGKTQEEESVRIVRKAYDEGINFFDTADTYNNGESEEIVGRAVKGIRHEVVLASKVGSQTGNGPNASGVSRYHIIRGVEASLTRMNIDHIDLLYIHWPTEKMNLEEMTRALDDLVRQGKILYPACSNFPAWLLCRTMWIQDLRGYAPIAVGQYPYNLIERGVEVEILPSAHALKVGIIAYRPLSVGFFTGKYIDEIPADSRAVEDKRIELWVKRYSDGLRNLNRFAEERDRTSGDAAIAWVGCHPAVTAVIVGISTIEQLERNIKAFSWEMTPEERKEAQSFFPTEVWEEAGGTFPGWRRSFDIV